MEALRSHRVLLQCFRFALFAYQLHGSFFPTNPLSTPAICRLCLCFFLPRSVRGNPILGLKGTFLLDLGVILLFNCIVTARSCGCMFITLLAAFMGRTLIVGIKNTSNSIQGSGCAGVCRHETSMPHIPVCCGLCSLL